MTNPSSTVRIVHLEDDLHAFELIRALVECDGLDCVLSHVEDATAYEEALRSQPDLILADFNLPSIDGHTALGLKRQLCPDTPFIFVSGSIGEEIAIRSLRDGANDFVLKDSLTRLPAAIRRALNEAREHRERMQAELRLRESEARFRRLSENAPDIIYRLSLLPYPHFDYISSAFTRITGYRPEDFYGDATAIRRLVHPAEVPLTERIINSGLVPNGSVEVRWLSREGQEIFTEQRLVPITDSEGRLIAVEGIARDITERRKEQEMRRQLEAQLFQAQKLETIGTLAGGIAHDFNNILTGILGYNELAANGLPEAHEVQSDLAEVRKAGLRAKDLVAQILTFSRKQESKLSVINLGRCVDEALKLTRASTPSSISIQRDLGEGVVRADPVQVHQIVLNLCTNAVHAMKGAQGTLSLKVSPVELQTASQASIGELHPGRYVCLSITDTGRGMAPETQRQIFSPFFTTKTAGEGTGLGLSLVKGIVLSYGGAILLHSALGQGSSFEIFFPACTDIQKTEVTTVPVPPGRAEHVAFIDDENSISTFVAARLEQLNYRVTVFNDPRAALNAILAAPTRFDAIVTDFTMPYLTGDELLRQLRQADVHTPAILTSGDAAVSSLKSLTETLKISLLAKPFTGEEIARSLHILLSAQPTSDTVTT